MMQQQASFLARMGIGLVAVALVTSAVGAQQEPAASDPETEAAESAPPTESPLRQPPTSVAEAKPAEAKPEKLVLADPDSKRYMPCRGPNDSQPDDSENTIKPNPKAAVLSEEAAKQHGFKPSPHKVDCPK